MRPAIECRIDKNGRGVLRVTELLGAKSTDKAFIAFGGSSVAAAEKNDGDGAHDQKDHGDHHRQ